MSETPFSPSEKFETFEKAPPILSSLFMKTKVAHVLPVHLVRGKKNECKVTTLNFFEKSVRNDKNEKNDINE